MPLIEQNAVEDEHANWFAGEGSSITSRASDQPVASGRLVGAKLPKFSAQDIVRTLWPAGVGDPPEQVTTMSAARSAAPPARIVSGKAEAVQAIGVCWPKPETQETKKSAAKEPRLRQPLLKARVTVLR